MKKILSIFIFAFIISLGFASDIEEKLSSKAKKSQEYYNLGIDQYDAADYQNARSDDGFFWRGKGRIDDLPRQGV